MRFILPDEAIQMGVVLITVALRTIAIAVGFVVWSNIGCSRFC